MSFIEVFLLGAAIIGGHIVSSSIIGALKFVGRQVLRATKKESEQ